MRGRSPFHVLVLFVAYKLSFSYKTRGDGTYSQYLMVYATVGAQRGKIRNVLRRTGLAGGTSQGVGGIACGSRVIGENAATPLHVFYSSIFLVACTPFIPLPLLLLIVCMLLALIIIINCTLRMVFRPSAPH
uniref:Uncharacterized protein n=1 Tax=Trypanosoma congolense (strain IL3000) TaxID=1068625 RepID=F9WB21_TRYCI|nr:hypothetical protein, unlikely [Trypanosoma congolense IL3000]